VNSPIDGVDIHPEPTHANIILTFKTKKRKKERKRNTNKKTTTFESIRERKYEINVRQKRVQMSIEELDGEIVVACVYVCVRVYVTYFVTLLKRKREDK
jgi:hypothetical protein